MTGVFWKRQLQTLAMPLLAVVSGLTVGALMVVISGIDLRGAASTFLYGIAGSRVNIGNTLSVFTPLVLTGLAVAFAMQAKVLNMGAEGQLYFGALGATMAALRLAGLPRPILLPLVLLAGVAFGGLFGLVPGYLKAKLGVNEVVLTLMLNEIAIQLNSWAVRGPLHPAGAMLPTTAEFVAAAQLPQLLPGTRAHYGLFLALGAALAIWFVLRHMPLGLRIRTVGLNARAARLAGLNVAQTMILAMAVAGGLAGLAGAVEVSGVQYRLLDAISPGYGYIGISVALLGRKQPAGVVAAALLMASLSVGAGALQRGVQLPMSIAMLMQSVIVLFVVGTEYLGNTGWRPAFMRQPAAPQDTEVAAS